MRSVLGLFVVVGGTPCEYLQKLQGGKEEGTWHDQNDGNNKKVSVNLHDNVLTFNGVSPEETWPEEGIKSTVNADCTFTTDFSRKKGADGKPGPEGFLGKLTGPDEISWSDPEKPTEQVSSYKNFSGEPLVLA